jgi:hypothetical protein
VNLVVDSDAARTAAILVPGGTREAPQLAGVPYDAPHPEVPYEERPIADFEAFSSFGRRARERLAPLVPDPLLDAWWPTAIERGRATGNLGLAVAQARHRFEGRWGGQTLELPQSQVCRFESFGWFTAHLLCSARRLREAYNAGLAEYRRVNRIRSRSHPVPDLARDGDWIEAPFWTWTSEQPRRRRLFVRRRGAELCLTDRAGLELALPLTEGDAAATVEALRGLPRGTQLRTRALATTLFARLTLSDLFLHGIGGAKYDELTDQICARFFGLRPPPYLVLSATLRLPIGRPNIEAGELRRVDGLLRELTYHPEVHAPRPAADGSEFDRLAGDKLRWIHTPSTPQNARQRCRAIRGANRAMQPWVDGLRGKLLAERKRLLRLQQADAILASREYAFCLHPERTLRALFAQVFP